MNTENTEVEVNTAAATNAFEGSLELEKLGEKLGEFRAYDSQLPLADIAGTRIVKCLYQVSPKTQKKLRENSYVRLPVKHLTEEGIAERIADLTPYFLAYMQEVESDIIKDEHKNGSIQVWIESLSMDKIIEHLESKGEGARLNKDKIEKWFKEYLYQSLMEQFAAKLGLDENSDEAELIKLERVLEAYKKKFVSLASGKTFIKEEDCEAMINVIKGCTDCNGHGYASDSLLGKRFISKLEGMSKKEDDLLMSL